MPVASYQHRKAYIRGIAFSDMKTLQEETQSAAFDEETHEALSVILSHEETFQKVVSSGECTPRCSVCMLSFLWCAQHACNRDLPCTVIAWPRERMKLMHEPSGAMPRAL